jgi:dTDP-4-dehydrorhamnose reductase
MNKIFFLGATGIIGKNFYKTFKKKYKIIPTYSNNKIKGYQKFNITNDSLDYFIKKHGIPKVIILAISLSNHDKVAIDKKNSNKINYKLIINLLRKIKKYHNIKIIFLSTQMVLNGKKSFSSEKIRPQPIITYGKQKLEVEKFIVKNFKNYLILRLAKVYGHNLRDKSLITNFIYKIKKKIRKFELADDQFFNPLYVEDLIKILDYSITGNINGIYHIGGPKRYSRFEILKKTYSFLKKNKKLKIKLIPRKLNSFDQNETHPLDTSFNINKFKSDFPIKLRDIDYVYKKIIQRYI